MPSWKKVIVSGSAAHLLNVTASSVLITGSNNTSLLQVSSPSAPSALFVSGSGNVGIGTTSPTSRLQVRGEGATSATTALIVQNSNQSASLVVLDDRQTRITSDGAALFVEGARVSPFDQNIAEFRYAGNGNSLIISNQQGVAGLTTSTNANLNINPSGTGATVFLQGKQVRLNNSNNNGTITLQNTGATGQTRLDFITGSSTIISISGSGNVGIGTTTPSTTLNVNGTTLLQGGQTTVRGSGATSATTALIVQNSTPTNLMTILDNGQFTYTTPTIILPASQSAYTISPVISASNVVGGQYYGVNITPTFFQTTGSQTETAFRVAATFTQSSAAATSGTNIIADFGASSVGSQFTITDVTSGSIYMVNDVSGLPIIEANSGWDVNIYNFPNTVFRKSGNNIELGVQSNTGSVLTFYADTILNEGYGFTYRTTQVSGSTSGAVTSSLWNITFGSVSSSVYVNAVVTGYDTASRDTITGDVKATIRYRSGVASIVGFNQSFSNTDNSDVSFNVVAGGTSGSLRVFGTGSRTYQWGATITTQVI